jgi:hypothetical protein
VTFLPASTVPEKPRLTLCEASVLKKSVAADEAPAPIPAPAVAVKPPPAICVRLMVICAPFCTTS